ncbi:uncharacterized protein LOC124667395 isoform X2 [Lolium rigidum]|nr:uncharacterized protein LOC124667395 isoform X2 [Lolium rigidum]
MKDPSNDQLDENVDPNVQQNEDFLRAARLKKKEVQSKNLRRKKSWLDKLLKGKRKATKPVVSTQRGAKQSKKKDDVQPQVQMEDDSRKKEDNVDNEKYNVIESFTQLLTTPTCDGGSFYDENLF